MGGQVLFEDALAARLNIIKPSQGDLERYLAQRHSDAATAATPRLTAGALELVDKLHRKGKIVYLVSGGFRQVRVIAHCLVVDGGASMGYHPQVHWCCAVVR
jgi:phosphoserine phosphatase